MSKNLTPEHLRCGVAQCPSITRLDDGRLFILGEYANNEEWAQAGDPGKTDSEAAIVISPDLLSDYVKDLVQTDRQQVGTPSGHPIASDGGEAVFGWLPHYADPLDVLTWRLSEAFGATISERQWLAARELLAQFEPKGDGLDLVALSGHQDFEVSELCDQLEIRAIKIAHANSQCWTGQALKENGHMARCNELANAIASALSSAVAVERERCVHHEKHAAYFRDMNIKLEAALRSKDVSLQRIRSERNDLRSLVSQVTAPEPQGEFEPEASGSHLTAPEDPEATQAPETPTKPAHTT